MSLMGEQARCQYCNRPLKKDESVMDNAGPVCKKKADADHNLETCSEEQGTATRQPKEDSRTVRLAGVARPTRKP